MVLSGGHWASLRITLNVHGSGMSFCQNLSYSLGISHLTNATMQVFAVRGSFYVHKSMNISDSNEHSTHCSNVNPSSISGFSLAAFIFVVITDMCHAFNIGLLGPGLGPFVWDLRSADRGYMSQFSMTLQLGEHVEEGMMPMPWSSLEIMKHCISRRMYTKHTCDRVFSEKFTRFEMTPSENVKENVKEKNNLSF